MRRREILASSVALSGVLSGCLERLEDDDGESVDYDQYERAREAREYEERDFDYGEDGGEGDSGEPDDEDNSRSDDEESEGDPEHLYGLSGNTVPDEDHGEITQREMEYEFRGSQHRLEVGVPENLISYYQNRARTGDYGAYVEDPYHEGYIQVLADEIQGEESANRAVDQARAFVQQLEYALDEVSAGMDAYPRYPIETLFDTGGDCEDTAILLASICRQMEFDCVLLTFPEENHMALGLAGDDSVSGAYYEYQGSRYYYVETTAPGWEIGEIPDEVSDASARIEDIDRHPILVFSWVTRASTEAGVEVEGEVRNVGTATARDVRVFAEFEDRSETEVASNHSSEMTIQPDQASEFSILVDPPTDTELRGRTVVAIDEVLHDDAVTDWASPAG